MPSTVAPRSTPAGSLTGTRISDAGAVCASANGTLVFKNEKASAVEKAAFVKREKRIVTSRNFEN